MQNPNGKPSFRLTENANHFPKFKAKCDTSAQALILAE
jgi:hypothetical protein